MELFVVRLDGLDVALADSKKLAEEYARRHGNESPTPTVEIVRIEDDSLAALFPPPVVAEAATA